MSSFSLSSICSTASVARSVVQAWGFVFAVLAILLAGCDSGGGSGENDDIGPPANLSISFAEDASFVVDSAVAVTARVTDPEERPVDQVVVRWSTPSGSGTVEPDTATTGTEGAVQTEWTLGSTATGPDAQSIEASVDGGEVTATEQVAVNPGPAARVTVEAAQDTIAVDSTTIASVVQLQDANGNEIPDRSEYDFSWRSQTPDTATVAVSNASTEASITGVADGAARIVVSTGGAPGASFEALKRANGAAADTLTVEVLQHELRGVWVTTTDSDVLNSQANIEEAMAFLAEHNFNAVFPVVWNNAATMYPSTVMDTLIGRRIDPDFEGRDPLQEMVDAGQEHGIAVIPWFEFGFAANFGSGGGPILEEKPGWAAKDRNDELLSKNGFVWMNAYRPAVRDFIANLVMEVVRNYDVDGIQGDDRMPAHPVEGGYSEFTKDLYRQEHDGQAPPDDQRDDEWMQWRADKLNAFGQRIYDEVKAEDEDLVVSWSPSVWSFSFREYLQDWPTWINQGTTDLVHPQVYRRDVTVYKNTLDAQSASVVGWDEQNVVGFYPGVLLKSGGYVAAPDEVKAMVRANRERGYQGEVFFFYEGLREFDDAAADALANSYYEDPAPLPFRRASTN